MIVCIRVETPDTGSAGGLTVVFPYVFVLFDELVFGREELDDEIYKLEHNKCCNVELVEEAVYTKIIHGASLISPQSTILNRNLSCS